ncbi:MAG: DUF2693 domain-containing protein [Chitinophagales bacterium]|nr:DUF2693 domain-containing protein [Chitinophagales bacterium]
MFELKATHIGDPALRVDNATAADPVQLQELALDRMNHGVCIFSYTKKDGSVKQTVGTLHPALLNDAKETAKLRQVRNLAESITSAYRLDESDSESDGSSFFSSIQPHIEALDKLISPTVGRKAPTPNPDWQNYFDLIAMDWRKYRKDDLLSVLEL